MTTSTLSPDDLDITDPQITSDTWIVGAWDDFCQILDQPEHEKTKGYYFKGHMRLEMPPVSYDHAENDGLISLVVNLLGMTQAIPLRVLANCTFRKPNIAGGQPDISVYLGNQVNAIPHGTGIVDLNQFPPPNLVIEISKTSILDDLGTKRALYESLGVAEYWVVDVQTLEIFAYKIANQGSWAITTSDVLPGLSIELLAEALRRNRETDHSQVGAWLLQQFQPKP